METRTRLTVRQEKFCINYFKCGNATEAALIAGYSKRTHAAIATENLQKPLIIARIKELQEKSASAAIASVQERKEILTQIIRAKLSDFTECGLDGVWFNIDKDTLHSVALKSVTSKTILGKEGADDAVYIRAELNDPVKAIAELNKMEHIYEAGTIVNTNVMIGISDAREQLISRINSISPPAETGGTAKLTQ